MNGPGVQFFVYRYQITKELLLDTCNWTPRDREPITQQLGARRTNQNPEFCYRYD